MLSLFLIFFSLSSSYAKPPASGLLLFQGGERRLCCYIDLLPTVWFYDRCVGDAFSRTGLAQELSELVGPSRPISAEAYGWRRSCSATDCDVRRRGWLQALQRLWSRPRLRVGRVVAQQEVVGETRMRVVRGRGSVGSGRWDGRV